jgi:dTDP-4-amino-4,6-dideoxygalactose transaminase
VAANVLWLPSSSALTDEQIERVCDAIRAHYQRPSGSARD